MLSLNVCECVTKWSIHSSYRFLLGLFFLLSLLFFVKLSFLLFLLSFISSFYILSFYLNYGSFLLFFSFFSLVINFYVFEIKRLNLSESFLYNKLQEFTINFWNSYTYSPSFLLCRLQFISVYDSILSCINKVMLIFTINLNFNTVIHFFCIFLLLLSWIFYSLVKFLAWEAFSHYLIMC